MNVIFDIGKVLIDFDFEKLVYSIAGDKAEKVIAATWGNPKDWNELDRGVLSDEEVLKLFIKKAPDCEDEIRDVFARMGECPKMREFTPVLINRLHEAGYKVYYLSNYFEYLMHTAPWALRFTRLMDGGMFSCRVNITKPDRRIYELLCGKYSLDPAECVFIDDSQKNVEGAENFGIKAIHYTGQSGDELFRQITDSFKGRA